MTQLAHPSPGKAPLRVGLILDSVEQPRWVHELLNGIVLSSFGEISLVVVYHPATATVLERGAAPARHHAPPFAANSNRLLYTLYSHLDARRYSIEPDPFDRISIEDLVAGCPRLHIHADTTEYRDRFGDDWTAVRAYDLDVALCLAPGPLDVRALGIAKHGVWSYHHGDSQRYKGRPAGFWEVMDGSPVMGSMLRVLAEDPAECKVIYRSFSRTDRLSVRVSTTACVSKSPQFVWRKLRDLHELGPEALDSTPESVDSAVEAVRVRGEPTNREMLGFLAKLGGRRIRNQLRQFLAFNQWTFAYHLNKSRAPASVPDTEVRGFTHLLPPKNRAWADPFPVYTNGKYHVFFEEYPFARRKGHISVMEMDRDGRLGAPVRVLEREYHLAYPFVFEWKGEHFMIPDTSANRTIELYRAVSYPFEWELQQVLIDNVWAVDATLVEIRGIWWIFTSIGEPGAFSCDDELHLFYASTPLGPWTPHPRNPVKSDVRSARPAGRIFQVDGEFYRPSQDCSERYGHSIVINKIVELNTERFREIPVSKILPEWAPNLIGTHTINAANGLTVIDGLLRRSKYF